MPHTATIEAAFFGTLREDDIEDHLLAIEPRPGTYVLIVSGLPEDLPWGPGMTATIDRTPKESPDA